MQKVNEAYQRLPKELLDRASFRGNEYAWRVDDIPNVITAARDANLLNIGGQLQFRLHDGGICECYWVEVNIQVPVDSNWETKIAQSAAIALTDFERLRLKYNFTGEGQSAFGEHLTGVNSEDIMWFVWYLEDRGWILGAPSWWPAFAGHDRER